MEREDTDTGLYSVTDKLSVHSHVRFLYYSFWSYPTIYYFVYQVVNFLLAFQLKFYMNVVSPAISSVLAWSL